MTSLSAHPAASARGAARSASALDRLARRLLLAGLARLQSGSVVFDDAQGRAVFGDRSSDGPHVRVSVLDPRTYRAAAFGGSLGAGESYMRGWWTCDDLTGFVQLLLRNRDALEKIDGLWRAALAPAQRLRYRLEGNTRAGSRRNIAAHYDLSNEFFALWLDPTMCYSAGYFERDSATMEQASVAKMDRLCRKLGLGPDHHLLEIGCGWGGMAVHAARRYGCHVTATTISARQAEHARRVVADAGLGERVRIIEQDYRDLRGAFDRIVSVEMIEAVGAEHTPGYFARCASLLKPDGLMALQAITIRDQYYRRAARTRDWLKTYIFPGSCLPSVESIAAAVRGSTDMVCVDLEDITPHYARTLQLWRERFFERIDEVRALGFDETFIRMWEYYLCHCEGAFRERHVADIQMVLARPAFRGEINREPRP